METQYQYRLFAAVACLLVVSLACSVSKPVDTRATASVQAQTALAQSTQQQQTEQFQQEQQLHFQQTELALESTATALSAAQTAAARPTATPSATPGPAVIQDNFSRDSGYWSNCSHCAIQDGVFYLGPFPSTNSAKGYYSLCQACGVVREYKMAVDVRYIEGPSDRGFGFVLAEADGSFVDFEITTWQVYGSWFYDKSGGDASSAWSDAIDSRGLYPTGYLKAGRITNHIEVDATANGDQTNYEFRINGHSVRQIELPITGGRVGLMVGLHSLGVAFDNFSFVGKPILDVNSNGY